MLLKFSVQYSPSQIYDLISPRITKLLLEGIEDLPQFTDGEKEVLMEKEQMEKLLKRTLDRIQFFLEYSGEKNAQVVIDLNTQIERTLGDRNLVEVKPWHSKYEFLMKIFGVKCPLDERGFFE